MKKNKRKRFFVSGMLLASFALWTAAVCLADVRPIGPEGSRVGFAAVNGILHQWFGVRMELYILTDWLELIPAGVAAGFALLGLGQWIRRKSLKNVDFSILALGGLYLVLAGAYILFEVAAVNSRPVLMNGVLEASYPSSTTLLTWCVMPAAAVQIRQRVKRPRLRRSLTAAVYAFSLAMAAARLLSGVHWATDIVGGVLLGLGLAKLYEETVQ